MRLDQSLVERGLFATREKARRAVMAGQVRVDGRRVDKPGSPTRDDARLELSRQRFEDSLIQNHAPPEHLELLLDWHEDYQQEWRARMLATTRAEIRAALLDPLGWAPRDPSEAS